MATPTRSEPPRNQVPAIADGPSREKDQQLNGPPITTRGSECVDYLFVSYRTQSGRPEFGEIRGQLVEITLPRPDETVRGSKEGDWLGFTRMPVDRDLWNRLLTGINTVDVEKSAAEELAISSNIDPDRMTASKYVSSSREDWETSPQYQNPATKGVYSDYLAAFLAELTRVVDDMSIDRLFHLSPSAWLSPATTTAYVGRDGIAIVFGSPPPRPGCPSVTIDIDKILDELLLPHLEGKIYNSSGPTSLLRFICDDEHYVWIKGNGHIVRSSALGNPSFLIFEPRYHAFWENFGMFRAYGDGTATKAHFQLVEFFGDISESNFTKQKAKARAESYASLWATASISPRPIQSNSELNAEVSRLHDVVEDLKKLLIQHGVSEPEIERFLDDSPWILEAGLAYESYRSQVTIPAQYLSRSEQAVCPDKFLKRTDGFWDILDLKRPDARIMVRKRNRTHASAVLTEAIAQVNTYLRFAREPAVRAALQELEIRVLYPDGLLLIGRRPRHDMDAWEDVRAQHVGVKIYTYDDLLERIEASISRLGRRLRD